MSDSAARYFALQEKVLLALPGAVPFHSYEVEDMMTDPEPVVRVRYQGSEFRIPASLHVEEIESVFLKGSLAASLIEKILRGAK